MLHPGGGQTVRMCAVDILGEPYTSEILEFPDDYEGAVTATMVHRSAEGGTSRGAVLHVHGYCDYFFQTAQAEFFTAQGFSFFALDLRKYGRSLLPHQTPNFCLELSEYYPELDAALDAIQTREGHERVLLTGHSTGGLIGALWAADRHTTGNSVADALVLNSPWLDLAGRFYIRTAGTEAINRLGLRRPYAVVPRSVNAVYAETLHTDYRGEWTYDFAWKPRESFAVRAGWLRAVRLGHRSVHRGIDVGAPVLTLCSATSTLGDAWTPEAAATDTVLDVKQIAKWSHQLSGDVTVVRVKDAIHDVFCSRPEVRQRAFAVVERWLPYALSCENQSERTA